MLVDSFQLSAVKLSGKFAFIAKVLNFFQIIAFVCFPLLSSSFCSVKKKKEFSWVVSK